MRPYAPILISLLGILVASVPLSCGVTYLGIDATTQVSTESTEDLSGPCTFDIVLSKPPHQSQPQIYQNGVFVIYGRGDSSSVFQDSAIRQMVKALNFSLIFAHECDAKSYDDFQSNPYDGPGRVLFQALVQLAQQTSHPELATANVALFGFSAAGVLAAEMATFAPSRILGIISYAPGSAHQDFAAFTPSVNALGVPSLFLANSEDPDAGTTLGLDFFTAGSQRGAMWAFGVQRGVGHCCTATTEPMILAWLPEMIQLRGGGTVPPKAISAASQVEGAFVCSPDGTIDAMNYEDCSITSATLQITSTTQGQIAWFPGIEAGDAWLTWVSQAPQQ